MTMPSRFKDMPELPIVRWPDLSAESAKTEATHRAPIVQRPLKLGQPITFWHSGNADHYLFGDDCHVAEASHRWMKHSACRIAFNPLFDGPVTLRLRHQVMAERPAKDLDFAATLNGRRLHVEDAAAGQELIEIPVPALSVPPTRTCILILYCTTAIVNDIVGGGDMRAIGLGLKELQFTRDV